MDIKRGKYFTKIIKGVNYEQITLSFIILENRTVLCFIDLMNGKSYWYHTFESITGTVDEVETMVNRYKRTHIISIENNYLKAYKSLLEGRIINNELLKHLMKNA